MIRAAALCLSVGTGFAALVYEVAWQKILATLLGSHSEATAAVLGLFLGGLALGYAFFGRVSRRRVERARRGGPPARLLLVYGLAEVGIGVYALVFHALFRGVQTLSTALPLGGGAGFVADVLLSGFLIGPPAVLMGATIPLLTQALARDLEDATRLHSRVYAFNTAGAFAGALAAGYWLVPALGLIGVLRAVALVNILAGIAFVLLDTRAQPRVGADEGTRAAPVSGAASLATAAALIGFAMMAIQTVLIRLGALSFGASGFTFAMVVAVFVLCIALGSLAVSTLPRVPAWVLVACLWLLLVSWILLYPVLQDSPYLAHVLRSLFRDQPAAFSVFHLTAFAALLGVIGLPVALSGASLPLLFHELRDEAGGLGAAAGRLYAWNTVGSLAGALLGGYVLLGWLDLHAVFRLALAAIAVAAVIVSARVLDTGPIRAGILLLAPALASIVTLAPWEPERLAAGLFRERRPKPESYAGPDAWYAAHDPAEIIFYDDDPTASIAVKETREKGAGGIGDRSIVTNGKSDGSLSGEYTTTGLLSLLPALFARHVERAFVIGWGTGVSAAELAALDTTREVVVAEISPAVIEAAPLFDHGNLSASTHPSIRITEGDAYRTLLRSEGLFDVIVSEPSNPWVAGVEMLYSVEFLEAARDRLAPGGVYSQWFHLYEIDDATVALALRTYASVFDHVAVWYGLGPDLILLGVTDPDAAVDIERLSRRALRPDFGAGLGRSRIGGFPELLAHELVPLDALNALDWKNPVHTLLHPRLGDMAARAFFVGGRGWPPVTSSLEAARLGHRNSLARRVFDRRAGPESDAFRARLVRETCRYQPEPCLALLADWTRREPESPARESIQAAIQADAKMKIAAPFDRIPELVVLFGGDLAPEGGGPSEAARATQLYVRHYHHAAPFSRSALAKRWSACEPEQAEACRAGREQAERVLGDLDTPRAPASR